MFGRADAGVIQSSMDDPTRKIGFELGDTFAEALTETTQSLVCVLDRDGTFMLFNDACERATGFTRQEVLGRPAFESVIPAEEAEAFRECSRSSGDRPLQPPGRALADEGRRGA
jgi:PAS domain S-box-containing protein